LKNNPYGARVLFIVSQKNLAVMVNQLAKPFLALTSPMKNGLIVLPIKNKTVLIVNFSQCSPTRCS